MARFLSRDLLIPLLLLPCGCGIQVLPTGSPEGLTPPVPGEAAAAVHVRYEVRCQECTVCYMASEPSCDGGIKGIWAKTVRLVGSNARAVWLEAAPASDDLWIQRARILVDGRVAVEFDGDRNPRRGETISIAPLR